MTLATGGNSTHDVGAYRYHVFTEDGDFTVVIAGTIDILIVSGGGAGGRAEFNAGGGGGGGGFLEAFGEPLPSTGVYQVSVGAGGTSGPGGFSRLLSPAMVPVVDQVLGGAGAPSTNSGQNANAPAGGGSGAGANGGTTGTVRNGGNGSTYGNNGGDGQATGTTANRRGGGGGGAGGAGSSSDPRNGGPGALSTIATALYGVPTYYGGGGGGASQHASTGAGSGGIGGGGAGAQGTGNQNGIDGSPNTGGGGGGAGSLGTRGSGGSGIVIIRYIPTTNTAPDITVNPSVNYNGYTRTGPANSPISVSFEAEDAEETGSDELTVEVRTAANGGGTLVATDDYTSGTAGSISIAHNASGLSEGSNTLYLRVGDGTDWSDDESFTLLVDRSAPTVGTITQTPNPAVP